MRVLKKNAIKAYKAFNSDWTCRDFQYEVGKTYHYEGKITLCEKGFHSCTTLVDCFTYYPYDSTIKVAEVLIWGEVLEEENDTKKCSSDIAIVKELKWTEVISLCNSGDCNSGNCNSGNCNSGNWNSGDYNSGNWNSGNWNSGNWNSGNCNSGNYNSGTWNSGTWNSGDWNSGPWNSGNWNSGNWNSGNCNSGNCNSGNRNSGNWNSGDYSSGYFNTPKQNKIFCFNKVTDKKDIAFPSFLYFKVVMWVDRNSMTTEEKEAHPEAIVTGGYLKTLTYKEAFHKSFEEAKKKSNWKKELALLKAIPNFDYAIFEEISGITKEELES